MGVLSIILVLVLVQGLFNGMEREEIARKMLPGLGEDAEFLRRGQETQLSGYGRVGDSEEIVRLPIERAMQIVIEEYGQ